MPWNLSGWSPGRGRTPLTYNLRAGQFRGMGRPRFFPSTTIINNNIFGNMRSGCCNSYSNFYNSGCCGGQNTTPEWMQWTMIGGMGLSALGEILGIFWPGKKSADVAEEAPADKKPAEDPYAKDWTELQNLYKDKGTFAHIGDKYICLLTNGKQIEATTPSDLMGKLQLELAPVNRSNNVVASSATVTPQGNNTLSSAFNNITWTNFDVTKMDDGGDPTEISLDSSGDTTCSTDMGTNVNAPITITVIKGGVKYEFELIDDANKLVNGQPVYKCITKAGTTLQANQIQNYILKASGEFYQDANTLGYNIALGNTVPSSGS